MINSDENWICGGLDAQSALKTSQFQIFFVHLNSKHLGKIQLVLLHFGTSENARESLIQQDPIEYTYYNHYPTFMFRLPIFRIRFSRALLGHNTLCFVFLYSFFHFQVEFLPLSFLHYVSLFLLFNSPLHYIHLADRSIFSTSSPSHMWRPSFRKAEYIGLEF